ncbi:MAG: protein kinase [Candidatus Obscuribacterales bacterium]|nr:protein kinase [Candidatus Obscuribacterales bacterium]
MKSLVGETVAQQYEVLDALGHGATSVVYKAKDLENGEIVALKVLHRHLIQKTVTLKRIEQEAHLATLLEHPNIVKVRRFLCEEGREPILVLDYVEGESLAVLLQRETNLTLPRAWKLFIQIADAMEHAHQKGIVHRNLKPGNIIIGKSDEGREVAHISDFGMAKLLPSSGQEIQELTQKGAVIGSPLYMSPEQCLGRTIDARADIYSLGCLMYAVLLGRPPLKGDHIIDTMAKHVSEFPPSFNEACPQLNLPIQVQAIVFKCMAKQPDDRYESMDALKLDLLRMQQGKKPKASSSVLTVGAPNLIPTPPKESIDPPNSFQAKVALGLLLALVVFSLGFMGWVRKSKTSEADAIVKEQRRVDNLSRRITGLSPLALLRQADELLMLKREQEAALVYKQAIVRAADLAEKDVQNREILSIAHQGLADVYRRVGKFKDARKEYEMALNIQALDPGTDAAARNRIRIEIASCMMHEGEQKEAISLLDSILNESKDKIIRARAQLSYGDIFIAQGRFSDAESRLDFAQKEFEGAGAASGLMMVIAHHTDLLCAQSKFEKAENILKDTLDRLTADSASSADKHSDLTLFAASELARIYCLQGKYDQAIAVLNAQNKVSFGASKARRMAATDALAASYFLSGDVSKASAVLDDVDEDPVGGRLGHPATIIRMFVESKQFIKAFELIEEIKANKELSTQERAELYSLKSFAQLKQGKAIDALESADKALEILEDSPIDEFRQQCWILKARALRAGGRGGAAEVIERESGRHTNVNERYDDLVPLYHQRIQMW